ncbi:MULTISPECIES: DUF3800 domain-containing protein [unclassified Thiocapsa]|uniref:DUF3800 domain-containing protein n=1 Tax=unclassified Thiocapsa TaxID=2641286 RepID=UPI0035AEEA3E
MMRPVQSEGSTPGFSRFTIYVDESGDHGLERINPEYPLFVLAFCRICDGTNACDSRLPFQVVFVDKKQNLAGLQLADLVCHPIGRHLLKPEQTNRAYAVVERKNRRDGAGRIEGYGLKTFP